MRSASLRRRISFAYEQRLNIASAFGEYSRCYVVFSHVRHFSELFRCRFRFLLQKSDTEMPLMLFDRSRIIRVPPFRS